MYDLWIVPYLLLPNLPHQPIDIAQQPPNLPDGRAQVVIDNVLHAIDDFLTVTVTTVPIFSFLHEKFSSWHPSLNKRRNFAWIFKT